mmetsp:Transcript_28175/g.66945  ORF Transcript_28175/g.66945 Transcript_28175/m.66945 type:complete len:366 (+) Transcript_28175:43-1140(+)
MAESLAWRIKVSLQWSGWLQYIPNMMVAVLVGLLLLIFQYLHLTWTATIFKALFVLLLAILLFDLVTVKMNLRPTEGIPSRRDHLDVFDVMRQRRSCRSFQWRDLLPEHRKELLDVVKTNLEPKQMLGSKQIRLEYIKEPLSVWPVVGCHEFLVAIAPKEYDRMAILDVGRSLQKVVLHAFKMGLATCWIGPGADHNSITKKLGKMFNEETDHIICVCAIGYPSWYIPTFIAMLVNQVSKKRKPLDQLFFAEPSFKTPLDVQAPPFARYGRCFEACQWGPSSFNAQPVHMVGQPGGKRFDFYGANSSRYYTPVAVGIWLANWETGCEALKIKGRFSKLSKDELDIKSLNHDGPVYDISWVSENTP